MPDLIKDWAAKKVILLAGKGGVGKSTIAEAVARALAAQNRRVLLVHVLQIGDEEQRLITLAPNLSAITLQASECFREYVIMKLRLKTLYKAFLSNKLAQYLERAAPGVREITMLGKVWFERNNYDHIVVDMPSTGYALTMLHTPFNFAALFPGGPIYADAREMIKTFSDSTQTAFVVVSLGEEMPAQESLELAAELATLMPANPAWLIVNRLTRVAPEARALHQARWTALTETERSSPLWRGLDFLVAREDNQGRVLSLLRERWERWLEIDEVAAPDELDRTRAISSRLISALGPS